jgi:hypothetical protein
MVADFSGVGSEVIDKPVAKVGSMQASPRNALPGCCHSSQRIVTYSATCRRLTVCTSHCRRKLHAPLMLLKPCRLRNRHDTCWSNRPSIWG